MSTNRLWGTRFSNESPVSVEVLQPQTPESLSALTENLLNKDPGERVQTAAEVVEQLRSVLGEFSSVSSGIDGSQSPSSARGSRTKRMVAAAGAVLTIIILVWIVIGQPNAPGCTGHACGTRSRDCRFAV